MPSVQYLIPIPESKGHALPSAFVLQAPCHSSHLVTQARHSHTPGRISRLQTTTPTKQGWLQPQGRLAGQEHDLGGPGRGAGLLPLMCLRLGNSSQNPYSISGSYKEPRLLHIWLQLHFILLIIYLYYLASSHTQSASYPAIHPSTPTNYTPVDPSIHPPYSSSTHLPARPHLHPYLSIFSFSHTYISPSNHPAIHLFPFILHQFTQLS